MSRLEFLIALSYLARGVECDRCGERATFVVQCSNGCPHLQCLACALHTDNERRVEDREFAWLN